jgi:small subunit ribosomal protein S9
MTNEVKTNNPNQKKYYIGVGRRKSSSATVYLKKEGAGKIEIILRGKKRKRSLEEYYTNSVNLLLYKKKIMKALELINKQNECDLKILVEGGGTTGQSDASASATAKACSEAFPDCRTTLKGFGLLTTDARRVERKKIGLKKARKAPQFSKR